MTLEAPQHIPIEVVRRQVLNRLDGIRVDAKEKGEDITAKFEGVTDVDKAAKAMDFINTTVTAVTVDYFERGGSDKNFTFGGKLGWPFTPDLSTVFYDTKTHALSALIRAHIPNRMEALSSSENLWNLWESKKGSKDAVRLLAGLTPDRILKTFERHIAKGK